MAPVVALPTLRSHPRWSPRWGLHGACSLRARSCGPSHTLSPLPPHPAALSSGGSAFRPPPTFIPHPWGDGGVWGAPSSSSLRSTHVAGTTQARRKHEAWHLSLCTGGGACRVAPVVALPTLRSHPRWSPRWGLHGAYSLRARSCGPSPTHSPLPPHPSALSSGGVRFPPPPTFIPHPWGGGVCGGRGGRPRRLPFVARMSQARRKHDASTRLGTWL